jgi:hypothetical protein
MKNKIISELQKCIDSPYYFATKYLTIKNSKGKIVKYTTILTEEEFNQYFKKLNSETLKKNI